MNSISHILVCSDGYPTVDDPVFPFVEQFVNAVSNMNIEVTVIAPQSLTKHFFRKTPLHPRYRRIEINGRGNVEIFQPFSISFSNKCKFLNTFFKNIAIRCAVNRMKNKPDVCYGHFWHCATYLLSFAKKNRIPLFVASGEASVKTENDIPKRVLDVFLKYFNGVIFASSKNKKEAENYVKNIFKGVK